MNIFDFILLQKAYLKEFVKEKFIDITGWKPDMVFRDKRIPLWDYQGKASAGFIPEFYFSTKKGVFCFKNGELFKVWDKQSFGMCFIPQSKLLLISSTWRHSFFNNLDFLVGLDVESLSLSLFSGPVRHKAHQMDYVGKNVLVTECYHNSILVIDQKGQKKHRWYPAGKGLHKPRLGPYKHFNSIYSDGSLIYVFAHNKAVSVHTGTVFSDQKSEVYILDNNGDYKNKISVDAFNGHNIYVANDNIMYCDSGGDNALRINNKKIFSMPGWYVRGLAVGKDFTLVGASRIGDKAVRENGDGVITFLDENFDSAGRLSVQNIGQIYDIRLRRYDFSSSTNTSG